MAKMLVRKVRSSHRLLAEGLVADVAWQGQAAAALGLDQLDRLVGVGGLLGQVPDGHVGAFAGEQHRHRPADAAVPTGDQGDLAGQLAAALVLGPGGVRLGGHLLLDPGLCLALRRLQLFLALIGHAVLHSVWPWRSPKSLTPQATAETAGCVRAVFQP
jgi:hypothetical protein